MPVQDTTNHITVGLRDGSIIHLRSIRPDDAPRLQDLFARLSPQSAFFRFLTCWKELAREKAEYLTRHDLQNRMALVATLQARGEEQLIGLASYTRLPPPEESTAEAAVVIQDQYQGMGLGTILLQHLARLARMSNICTFVGTVHTENLQMLEWLESSNLSFEWTVTAESASDIQVRVELP